MPRAKVLLPSLIVAALVASSAQAGWVFLTSSVFQPEKHKEAHPKSVLQTLAVPDDAVAPRVCVAYENNSKKKKKGKVVTTVHIGRGDASSTSLDDIEPLATLQFSGNVKDNAVLECQAIDDLERADILVFETSFEKMPKLKLKKRIEYFSVHGVVSTAGEPEPDVLFQPPPEKSGWLHFANSVLEADVDNHTHPDDFEQAIIMPADARSPLVCTSYLNSSSNKNQGSVTARVSIARDLTTLDLEQIDFGGDVSKNEFLECVKVDDLNQGAIVFWELDFHGVPNLKSAGVDWAGIRGVVSTAGEPVNDAPDPPADDPPADDPPDDDPPNDDPPDDPPPPPSDDLSDDDQRAVSSLLIKTKKTQLWRAKNDNPTKWIVVGPKTRAIDGTNELIPSTAGYGDTIAKALKDYENKQGKLDKGDLLSKKEREAIEWYCKMKSSGPTSVRHDSSGGYHGEFYRSWSGTQHKGPLKTFVDAIDYLKKQGL